MAVRPSLLSLAAAAVGTLAGCALGLAVFWRIGVMTGAPYPAASAVAIAAQAGWQLVVCRVAWARRDLAAHAVGGLAAWLLALAFARLAHGSETFGLATVVLVVVPLPTALASVRGRVRGPARSTGALPAPGASPSAGAADVPAWASPAGGDVRWAPLRLPDEPDEARERDVSAGRAS